MPSIITGKPFKKVLIANRGEIAVRVIRAAKDAGLYTIAVYADSDANAPFVKLADEAFALKGNTAAETYLDINKVIEIAKRSGAEAIHPGYGFLSENADFAQAVNDAGIVFIGPSPQSIRDLGDKVTARHIATRVGAPLVPGTKEPVKNAQEVQAFADEFGLPIAIKAAFGGGGRGMKVAYNREEIPELFESATREALAAFGRGECFVERYLEKPRHVEAQILADQHGNVVVMGTRDCSVQRRFQKLIEEAPAPYLTLEQRQKIHSSAKAICKEAKYFGAGTVEYLVAQDGLVSFLEVNTRLQVEHPVTEETAGVDLVLAQFAIARGEVLPFTEDPHPRGHSIEFRINGEDPGRNFLPAPGRITKYSEPAGPGVRVDSGVVQGDEISGQFDSMLAKLIITAPTRELAIARAKRAMDEYTVDGIATVIPFFKHALKDPAFVGDGHSIKVHTRWIETEFNNTIEPFDHNIASNDPILPRQNVVVEVDGRRVEVSLPGELSRIVGGSVTRKPSNRPRGGSGGALTVTGDAVPAPMQGTIVKVSVKEGQQVAEGDILVVLEAMKMENPVTAHKAGKIVKLTAEAGQAVTPGSVLMEIKND